MNADVSTDVTRILCIWTSSQGLEAVQTTTMGLSRG
jgi:hypothetical protein